MGAIKILDANCILQHSLWLQLWSFQSTQEVFNHPEYVKLFCRPNDSAFCAYMEVQGKVVLFPFILRPLSAEEWAGSRCQYFDIISPYGYGGPACSDENSAAHLDGNGAKLFWKEFDAWAITNKVVTCFVRFSPCACHLDAFTGKVEHMGENVIRPLCGDLTDIWNEFDHKVRTNIRRARRKGLRVEIDTCGSRIEEFKKIYYATMERRNAQSQYYFPEDFFSAIIQNLTGKYVFFHTLHANKVVSTELVLVSQDHLYSFLGGTDRAALKLYPNEIIKDAVIRWGIEHGKKTYVLGGGYDGQDGIFRYKKSFAPNEAVPYLVGKKIYDEIAYQSLCAMRKKYETAAGNNIRFDSGFFPAYRNCGERIEKNNSGVHRDVD